MPKINVYLNDEDKAWMQENNISPSKELQHRLNEIRNGEDHPSQPAVTGRRVYRIRKKTVTNNKVSLKPGQQPVGSDMDSEGNLTHVYVLEPT